MTTINDNFFIFEKIVSEFTSIISPENLHLIKIFNPNWTPNTNYSNNRILYFTNKGEVEKIYELNMFFNICTIKRLSYKSDNNNPDNEDIDLIVKYLIKMIEINIKNIEIINLTSTKILFYTNNTRENDKNWVLYKKKQLFDIENRQLNNPIDCYVKTIILDTSFTEMKINLQNISKQQLKENIEINKNIGETNLPTFSNITTTSQVTANPFAIPQTTNSFTNPNNSFTTPSQTTTNSFITPSQPTTNSFTTPQPTTNSFTTSSQTTANPFTTPQPTTTNSFTTSFSASQPTNAFANFTQPPTINSFSSNNTFSSFFAKK